MIVHNIFCKILGAPKELYSKFAKINYDKHVTYPPELRKFALILNFLSTKAYDYVRDIFRKVLPHKSTLYRWYRHVNDVLFQFKCPVFVYADDLKIVNTGCPRTRGSNLQCVLLGDN
jgi:hypothetical protein